MTLINEYSGMLLDEEIDPNKNKANLVPDIVSKKEPSLTPEPSETVSEVPVAPPISTQMQSLNIPEKPKEEDIIVGTEGDDVLLGQVAKDKIEDKEQVQGGSLILWAKENYGKGADIGPKLDPYQRGPLKLAPKKDPKPFTQEVTETIVNIPKALTKAGVTLADFISDAPEFVTTKAPAYLKVLLRTEDPTILNTIVDYGIIFSRLEDQTTPDNKDYSFNKKNPPTSPQVLEALKGPNLLWELYQNAFIDHRHEIEGFKDASIMTNLLVQDVVGNTIGKGTWKDSLANTTLMKAISNYAEIPEDQQNSFIKALTFGGEILFSGGSGIYKIGAQKVLGGVTKLFYPNIQKTAKIFNIANKPKIINAKTKILKEDYPSGPWSKKTVTPSFTDAAITQGSMAFSGGAAYGTADFILSGTGYEDASLLFGLAGMMSGPDWGYLKKTKINPRSLGNFTARSFNILGYYLLAGTSTAVRKVVGGLSGGTQKMPMSVGLEQNLSNLYLRGVRGYSQKEIKRIEQKAIQDVNTLKKKYGEEKGTQLALEKGLIRSDGTVDINLEKAEYMDIRASDLKMYKELVDEMENIKDVGLKNDLKATAKRADELFRELSVGFKGLPEDIYGKVQMTLAQAIHLSTIRSYQDTLLSKVTMGAFGNFKKGQIVNNMEKVQRQIDKQVMAIEEQLLGLKLKDDASDVTKMVYQKLNTIVKMETKSKSEHYSALVRLRNKFTKNKENDIDAEMANAGGLLRVFEFDRTKNDINTFRAYNLFQSKKIRDKDGIERFESYPYKNNEGYTTGNKIGILPQRLKESNRRYEELFEVSDANDYFVNIEALERRTIKTLEDDLFDTNIAAIVGEKIPTVTGMTVIKSARRRGLNQKRKTYETSEEYEDFLEEVIDDNAINVRPPKDEDVLDGNMIPILEQAILNSRQVIEEVPTLLSVREWHGLRSRAMRDERRLWNASTTDYKEYNKLKNARKELEKQFDKINPDFDSTPEILTTLKNKFESANDYYAKEVSIFNEDVLLDMFSTKAKTLKYSPDEYMSLFFTHNKDLSWGRSQFDNLFAKRNDAGEYIKNKNGKYVHDEEAVDLLLDGLGKAISEGKLKNDPFQIIKNYEDIIGPERTKYFQNLHQQRNVTALGKITMSKPKQKFVDEFEGKLDEILTSDIDEATKISIGQLKASIYGQLDTLTSAEIPRNMRKYFKENRGPYLRDRIVKALFDADISPTFAITEEASEGLIKGTQGSFEALANKLEIPKDQVAKHVTGLLPRVDNVTQKHPLESLLDVYGNDKQFVDSLKSILVDELHTSAIKKVGKVNILGADQVAKSEAVSLAQKASQINVKQVPRASYDTYGKRVGGNVSLSKEIDLVEFSNFFERRQKVLNILYRDNPEHLKNLKKLLDVSAFVQGAKASGVNIGGVASPYSMQMAVGRFYNVMKGVVSPRYMLLEGGTITARVKMQESLNEMFLSPTAAKYITDAFVNYETKFQPKLFLGTVSRILGFDLTKEEESKLINAALESREFIRSSVQPASVPFFEKRTTPTRTIFDTGDRFTPRKNTRTIFDTGR